MSGDLEQNFLKIDNFQSKFLKILFSVRLPLKIPRSGGITENKNFTKSQFFDGGLLRGTSFSKKYNNF